MDYGGKKVPKNDSKGPGTERKGLKGPGWEEGAQLRKKGPNEGREGKAGGRGGKRGCKPNSRRGSCSPGAATALP